MNKNIKSRQQDFSFFFKLEFINIKNKRSILKITFFRWLGITHQEILSVDLNDTNILEKISDDPYQNELEVSSFEDSCERDQEQANKNL